MLSFIQVICSKTIIQEGHHESKTENPTNDALRGLDSGNTDKIPKWSAGLLFLYSREECLLKSTSIEPVINYDPEFKISWRLTLQQKLIILSFLILKT